MKFVIDTTRKAIILEESTNLATFVELIEKMLGDDWKSYMIEKTVVFSYNWNNVYVRPYVYPTFPTFYTTSGKSLTSEPPPAIITYSSDSANSKGIVTGYNIK